jgi:hypothetical protein
MIPFVSRDTLLKGKAVCPDCNRESADNQVCTSLGCGKRIDVPVRLFARTQTLPVGKMGSSPRLREGGGPGMVQ